MSIYDVLSLDIPLIAYSAMHQARKGVTTKEYTETMEDFHRLVREESAKVESLWKDYVDDLRAKSIQASRGNLSQFLSTPLQSDLNEIQRIIGDQITHVANQLLPKSRLGLADATEGKILWEQSSATTVKKLLAAGQTYLHELGFKVGKGKPDIFESNFYLEGGLNFDIIEHVVRDRMGVYTPVHGKHIKEFDAYAYAAHNLVYLKGALSSPDVKYEAAIHFSKGETKYAPFRNGLKELLDLVQSSTKLPHVSVWQRKLGLGSGREFILRFRFNDKNLVKEFVSSIASNKEKPFVKAALLNSGHLLLKELIQ